MTTALILLLIGSVIATGTMVLLLRNRPRRTVHFCDRCSMWFDDEGYRTALLPTDAVAADSHDEQCSDCVKTFKTNYETSQAI